MLPNVHVLTLRETPDKMESTATHLKENGISFKPFFGMNCKKWGLTTRNPYELDNPGSGYIIKDCGVTMHLSHYWMWRTFQYEGFEEATILEDDCRLVDGWKKQYINARNSVPDDWDMLMIGSCCTQGRPTTHILNNVFNVKYPLCTHAYIVRKRSIDKIIETQEKSWAQVDISLFYNTYPLINVYTILPRIANQEGTFLHP